MPTRQRSPTKPSSNRPTHANYKEIMESFAAYIADDKPKLESPSDVAQLLRPVLASKEQEEFHVLLLDTKNRLTHDKVVTVGLVDRSQIHAREVFRAAIRANCSRTILVHNHPSNDPTPSAQDSACTRELVAAGKIIGIEVLDHVIIGMRSPTRAKDYLSFREEGLL
jgi:DNA repair protein RadC